MEALILYFVLFFPGIIGSPLPGAMPQAAEPIPFSVLQELGRTLTYSLPALALLWYLMSDKNGFSALKKEKPHKRDIFSFIIGLPGLILIGFVTSLLAQLVSASAGTGLPPGLESPAGAAGWIVLFFSCMGTGYLEESYFRYYLLTSDGSGNKFPKPENQIPVTALRIAFSTVLFSICHIYEGPWGVLNAVLAGVLLSVLFTRYRSFHGIAWAHGAYNFFVYWTCSTTRSVVADLWSCQVLQFRAF